MFALFMSYSSFGFIYCFSQLGSTSVSKSHPPLCRGIYCELLSIKRIIYPAEMHAAGDNLQQSQDQMQLPTKRYTIRYF